MGPFEKLRSKLKGQQKETKNEQLDMDSKLNLLREQHQSLVNGNLDDDDKCFHDPQCLRVEHLDTQAKEDNTDAVSVHIADLSFSLDFTKRVHDNGASTRREMDLLNSDLRESGEDKIKGGCKESRWFNSEQRENGDFNGCNRNKGSNSEQRESGYVNVKETKVPSMEVKNESSDLGSSSLLLSLGLNRIRTRLGPSCIEEERKVIITEGKYKKAVELMLAPENYIYQKSYGENLVQKVVDRIELHSLQITREPELCKTSISTSKGISSNSPQGKTRSKTELQRLQRFHSGRRCPDQITIPRISHVFASSSFSVSNANEKLEPQFLCHAPPKLQYKSDFILEKNAPSSLLSCLNNEFGFDMEVTGKELNVIKEADPSPTTIHSSVFKKLTKDIKSFSHELGPRAGRSYDVHRPHSDNDLEELLAGLRARFNTAREKVDAELKHFAADLIEILDRNTDSFPKWKEKVEDILVLAQRCTKLSPIDFSSECEKIVHELDDRRQELPMGLLKQLHTRMLYILTRCSRLLQFQKGTISEQEGLHKAHQFLKGVPSVALPSPPVKRGKVTTLSRKLFSEVLDRNDALVSKVRKHRLALEKSESMDEQPCSPVLANVKKSLTVNSDNFNLPYDMEGSTTQVDDESTVTQRESKWDHKVGELGDTDPQISQVQKACWLPLEYPEREEPELVLCRICEEQVLTSQLQPHSFPCSLADAYSAQSGNIDERLRMLADGLEKIGDITVKDNHMAIDDSPDMCRPFKLNGHYWSDISSLLSSDLIRVDDTSVSNSWSVEDLRGLSLINFKRSLGKPEQGAGSSSAGSGTTQSTLTTPRTSQLDLLWAERNSLAEQEDVTQIYELASIARDIASKNPRESKVPFSLTSCSDDLHQLLSQNKVPALTIDTFGRRIEKLLKEKTSLLGGAGDAQRFDSYEDDGMSTDDGFQSLRSTPTHPSSNDQIRIEDFYILKPISRGAFGRVFLARKRSTGDLFAIKVLRKIDMIWKNAVENILAERDILITVCNPFVVRFFYSFTCRDNLYLVMEYLNGGDLYSLLRHMGCLDEDLVRVYIAELVLALEYLHSLGIVHRDLKPDNILIAHDGHIKLTDFGLSKVGLINSTDDLSGPTNGTVLMEETIFENCGEPVMRRECRKEQSAVGTPDYLAPEILLGTDHGYTADWWSVGIILFECLTGLPPFNAEHPQIIFDNILNRKIPWPHIPEDMSNDAKELINRLLTEDPNQRLGSKGASQVKNHPFFKDISWDNLTRQKAAFVPIPESIDDTSYFTSRHLESFPNSSPQFGYSSDCETSCSSSGSMKVTLNEGDEDYGDLANFQNIPSVERTFNNFTFKNASQLANINYDLLSQTGRDYVQRKHSYNQSQS